MKIHIYLFMLVGFSVFATEKINFNQGWKFKLGDTSEAKNKHYNDEDWRVLNLPHDWSIEGEYSKDNPMGSRCGYLPAGIAWYRKTIKVPEEWRGKHIEIAFDGISMNSTVWVNGNKLGFRPYAWVSFSYDISKEVEKNDVLTFAVRVDNDKQPSARWYSGSGIYANTWIKKSNHTYFSEPDMFIKTKNNVVTIESKIINNSSKRIKGNIITTIYDSNNKVVAKKTLESKIARKKSNKNSLGLSIEQPKKWSVESPYLYRLVSEIKVKGKIVDTYETKFGIRDIKWDSKGFWINGKNIKLQGVCNHQDAGAFGAAVPDKILRYRLQQLKNMGVNSIRTAHNAQTPQFYDMCDEMGFLVMDEFFDGWLKKADNDYGAHYFAQWWKQDLTDLIKRDRNHPSVVIYSLGNETHGEIAPELVKTCHELDSTRLVTSGHSGSEHMDILGVNGASEQKGWIEENLKEGEILIGTENTHTFQVRGFYRTKTWYRDGYPSKRKKPHFYPDLTKEEVFKYDFIEDKNRVSKRQTFTSSYDNAGIRLNSRHNIQWLRDRANFAGAYRWTGFDYLGEANMHGGWPFRAFMGGAIDLANFEKDLYYLYQSQWTKEAMVHILPHWTHPTVKLGTEIPVWVYSNCDEVELFFNGKSLGRVKPGTTWDKMQCQWMVTWEPGELKAIGYKNNLIVGEVVQTAGVPSKIELSVDGNPLENKKNDVVQVRVVTQDENENFYPYGENRTYFKVLGSGKIRALDNGSPVDMEKHYEAESRIAFYGLTRAYVESLDEKGDITLLASSILGEKKLITSTKVSVDMKLISLRGRLMNPKIEVYYTLDGSKPTKTSKKYNGSFDVSLGTRVKALVTIDGEETQYLEEEFSNKVGFLWGSKAETSVEKGDQAEETTYKNVLFAEKIKGYNGKGYIEFNKPDGGSIEWYQENDGGEGVVELVVRYMAFENKKAVINVNGHKKEILFPVSDSNKWSVLKIEQKFLRGANTVKIEALNSKGLLIDELLVK